jgi:hypothetical protein
VVGQHDDLVSGGHEGPVGCGREHIGCGETTVDADALTGQERLCARRPRKVCSVTGPIKALMPMCRVPRTMTTSTSGAPARTASTGMELVTMVRRPMATRRCPTAVVVRPGLIRIVMAVGAVNGIAYVWGRLPHPFAAPASVGQPMPRPPACRASRPVASCP